MVFSSYKKQRILFFYAKGYKAPTISKLLREESLPCSQVGVAKFIKKFEETGTIARRVGSGRPSKVTAEIRQIVEDQMRLDDETTAVQLYRLLKDKGYNISVLTIFCAADQLSAGHLGGPRIASIFERETRRSSWRGLENTCMIPSTM